MNRVQILREVVTKLTPMLAGRGLRVTQIGTQAFCRCDPRTGQPVQINIPMIPDGASEEFCRAIQGFIDHEVAHALFTDFSKFHQIIAIAAKLAPERGMTTKQATERLHSLDNIVEDTFIEREMSKRFKGTGYNLDQLYTVFLDKMTSSALEKVKGNPNDEFSVLLVPLARAWAGQDVFHRFLSDGDHYDHPLVASFTKLMPEKVRDSFPKLKNSAEVLKVAQAMFDILYPPPPPPPPPPPAAPPSDKPDDSEGESDDDEKSDSETGEGSATEKPEDEDDKGSEGDKEETEDKAPEAGDGAAKPDEEETDGEEGEEAAADEADEDDTPPADDASGETGEDEVDEPAEEGGPEDGSSDDAGDSDDGDDGGSETPEARSDDEEASDSDAGSSGADEGDAEEEVDTEAGSEPDTGEAGSDGEEIEEEAGKGGDAPEEVTLNPFAEVEIEAPDDLAKVVAAVIGDEALRETRDAKYTILTRDWDVIEPPEGKVDDGMVAQMENDVRHMVGPMQKSIERMMAARSQAIKIAGYRSGRLNSAGLHRLTVNDDRVFRRVQIHRTKETAVTLLVDNSGSMRGSKVEAAMKAAYALSQTLERVGVKHEVLGFTAHSPDSRQRAIIIEETKRLGEPYVRHEPLHMPIYKTFEERTNPKIKERFVMGYDGTVDLDGNVDGECVRYAGHRLLQRREPRKVMIVLSDGAPCGCNGHSRELASDLHRAVAELEKAKVDVVGLGIMTEAVKTFYPKFAILKKLNELPGAVMGELTRILSRD